MKVRLPLLLLGATLFLSGCGSDVQYVAQDVTVLTPKPRDYDMPFSYETPTRAHKVLGDLTVALRIKPDFQQSSTFDRAILELRQEAGERGADAIVGLKTLDGDSGSRQGRLTLKGTLVIWTEPPPLPTASR